MPVEPATSETDQAAPAPGTSSEISVSVEGAGAHDDPVVITGRQRLGGPFWRLWWATAISSSGDGLVTVALPLLALTLTRDPLAIAGVVVAQRASMALAALPAGLVADRFQRRTVMLACNVVSGLAMIILVLAMTLGLGDLVMVYLVAAVLAVCDVTYTLALQAAFPDVIASAGQLGTANARLMGVDIAGEQFAGPGIGGVLFAVARRVPFLSDGLSFFLAALLVRASIPRAPSILLHAGGPAPTAGVPGQGPSPARADGRHQHSSGWRADFRAGLRVFGSQKALKLLAATMGSISFTNAIVLALLVLYGERTLHLDSTGYGIFVAAASCLGIAGSFSGGAVQRYLGGAKAIVGGTALAAISYLGLAFTHQPVAAALVFGLQEIGVAVANVASVTARQRLIPRSLYGRVGSVHRLIVGGAAPIGALFGGFIASVSNVRDAFLFAGVLEVVMLAGLAPLLVRTLGATEVTPKAA